MSKFQPKNINALGISDILRPNGLQLSQLTPEVEVILAAKIKQVLNTPSDGVRHVLDYAYVKEWLHQAAFSSATFSLLLFKIGWRPDALYLAKAGKLKYKVKAGGLEIEVKI